MSAPFRGLPRRDASIVGVLLLLMLANLGSAYWPLFHGWHLLVSMGIAAVQTLLTVSFLMGVKGGAFATRAALAVALAGLLLMIGLIAADELTRVAIHVQGL